MTRTSVPSLCKLDATRRIVDIDYSSLEQSSRLDVKCLDTQESHDVVETQMIEGLQKRVLYNVCVAYTTQLGVGDDDPTLGDVMVPAEKLREERGRLFEACDVLGSKLTSEGWAHLELLDRQWLAELRGCVKTNFTWPDPS